MNPTLYFDAAPEDNAAFQAQSLRSAAALHALGVGAGDVVAFMLHNEPLWLELVLAARSLGAHYCLINWNFKSAEARHVLQDSGAKVLVVHADLLDQIRDAVPSHVQVFTATPRARTVLAFDVQATADPAPTATWESHRDSVARPALGTGVVGSLMVYTSGTTGLPKGVKRSPPTALQLQQMAQITGIVLGIEKGMRALVSAPMYHSAPASYVLQAALQDAHLWIEPRFDAEQSLRLIATHRITHAYLVPTMMRRMLRLAQEVRGQYDVSSLRFVACTGAPCPTQVKQAMIEWLGPIIHESYAASELGWITHVNSADALHKPGSAGRALPGTVLKILNEDGGELPAGEVGLIHARQEAVPDFTYTNNDAARRKIERHGLWTLGDMGFKDAEGFLYVVDRQNDMIISGGVNIYPAEIEAHLVTMPGVADCAVFGIPDEDFGESVLAAVQPVAGSALSSAQVQAYLRERIAGYKVPRRVTFHAQLPREDTGKIFKRKLRDPYWEGMTRRV